MMRHIIKGFACLPSDEGLALLFQHHDTPILKWLLSLVRHIATSYRQTEMEGALTTPTSTMRDGSSTPHGSIIYLDSGS